MDWSGRDADGPYVVPIAGTSPAPSSPAGVVGTVDSATTGRLAAVPNMSYSTTGWAVAGRLADGTTVTVGAVNAGGTDRLAAVVGTDYTDHGILDPGAPLPIAVRLPDGRGWVVAAPGAALRHRPPGQTWRPGGLQAALLPDAGPVEVEISRAGRPASVVRLG